MRAYFGGLTAVSLVLCGIQPVLAMQFNPNINVPQQVNPQILRPQIVRPQILPNLPTERLIKRKTSKKTITQPKSVPQQEAAKSLPSRRKQAPIDVLPPMRPDLAGDLAQLNAAREIAEIKDLLSTGRAYAPGTAQDALNLFGLGNQPAGSASGADPNRDQAARAAANFWRGMRGGNDIDALSMLDGLGLPSNKHHSSTVPGLVPDPNHVPVGNIAGQDATGADVDKVLNDDGSVTVTKTVVSTEGSTWIYRGETNTLADGTPSYTRETTVTRHGAWRETYTDYELGFRSQRDFRFGPNGYSRGSREDFTPPSIDRTMTGEENLGGGWCPPSGWGCGSAVTTAAELKARSQRSRPAGPDEGAGNVAARVPVSPYDLVVNPDANAMQGGGSGPSARGLDGGKLINPGDPDL